MSDIKKIIVADDQDIVRYAVKIMVEKTTSMRVVADTGDGSAVLKLCREHNPDLLLLDITLPNRDGMSILKQAKKESRDPEDLKENVDRIEKTMNALLKLQEQWRNNQDFEIAI